MRRPPARPRRLRALACGLLVLAACDEPATPVVGLSTSTRFVDAARLALADAGARGAPPLDTVVIPAADNSSAPAVRAAETLADIPGLVAVVGHSNSAASLAASQIYNAREIVQIAPHSSAVIYSEAGPWSFRLVPPDDAQAAFIVEQLTVMRPTGAHVAILYVNDDYGRGLLADVADALESGPHEIAVRYPHTAETGMSPAARGAALATLEETDFDVLLWLGRASVLDVYIADLRRIAPEALVIGADGVAAAPQLVTGDGRWDGVRFVDFVDLRATAATRDFARRYERRFGTPAVGPDALTYDATGLVLAAVADGAGTPAEVRRWLLSLGREREPFPGITGPIRFEPDGDASRSYVLRTVEDPV